ncbi:MAG: AAA family ATPase [Nitrospirae bacterium]|nr:AAA family ATPase [Nitrospirota bacterium]
MKIAVTGKGGVGKTTLSSALARAFSEAGHRVLVVDADPDANLAQSLGIAQSEIAKIKPIALMADLIEERTGAKPGAGGSIFKLNPKVDDIPDEFAYVHKGIKLLVMGRAKTGGAGCYCPENVLLKSLIRHLILRRDEVVVLDMEAGIEHLTRGTTGSVDAFIVVVEPGGRSVQTAKQVASLASDLGVRQVYVVGNKVRGAEDRKFIEDNLPGMEVLGFLSYSAEVINADLRAVEVYDNCPGLVAEVEVIKARIEALAADSPETGGE